MVYNFGFELEGFLVDDEGNVLVPNSSYPTDSFPGLVELRTQGGAPLNDALFKLASLMAEPLVKDVNFILYETVFKREQRQELRKHMGNKQGLLISNLYNKSPRLIGNKTLASFQINISTTVKHEYFAKKHTMRTYYTSSLIDIPTIIRSLDEEFAAEIKESGRQAGFYAIKDSGSRLEYRSLPNFVAGRCSSIYSFKVLEARIKGCL